MGLSVREDYVTFLERCVGVRGTGRDEHEATEISSYVTHPHDFDAYVNICLFSYYTAPCV